MSDQSRPSRIVDEGGPGADLLRAARAYRPGEASKRRTLAAVGLTAGSVGAAKSLGLLGALKAFLGTKTGLAVLLLSGATLTVGVTYEATRPSTPPTTTSPVATVAVPPASESGPIVMLPPITPVMPSATQAPGPASVTVVAPAPRPTASASAASPEATLRDELAVLDRARSAEHDKDSRAAIAALDEYDARFPSGQLAAQSQVLRIEVLSNAGDKAGARKLADAFLARHPQSVLAPRVRALRATLE